MAATNLGATVDTGAPLPDRQHEYAYDTIGNRVTSNRTGSSTYEEKYTTNALNQYVTTDSSHPGKGNPAVIVSGTGDPASRVVVAGGDAPVKASWRGNYWSAQVPVANTSGPWSGLFTLYSGKNVASSPDLARIDLRVGQIAAKAQAFTYDLDGNLTSDGVWDYVWDAENRLVRMTNTTAAVSGGYPARSLEFRYDYLGRRVQKLVYDVTNSGSPIFLSGLRFLYDGWNLVAEYLDGGGAPWSAAPGALARSHVWGLDIARSMADAGGVGALLQITDHATGKAYFPGYDGNGNVIALLNASTGALAAAYEYSPYGELLRSSGDYAKLNPFRFSTKYQDDETGLLYYGRRYFHAQQGRFLGRDPKEESGGIHLYGFCQNDGVNRWDRLGMDFAIQQRFGETDWLDEWEIWNTGDGYDAAVLLPGTYSSLDAALQARAQLALGVCTGSTGADEQAIVNDWASFVGKGDVWNNPEVLLWNAMNPVGTPAAPFNTAQNGPNLVLLNLSVPDNAGMASAITNNLVTPGGTYSIVVHGTPNQAIMPDGSYMDATAFAGFLMNTDSGYTPGTPILLLSCNAGAEPSGFAQQLANVLHAPVAAPSQTVWVDWPDFALTITQSMLTPTGPNTGQNLVFYPQSPQPLTDPPGGP